jgi:hypothetical protein
MVACKNTVRIGMLKGVRREKEAYSPACDRRPQLDFSSKLTVVSFGRVLSALRLRDGRKKDIPLRGIEPRSSRFNALLESG